MKKWYLSKTIWINSITLIVALLGVFSASELIDPKLLSIITGIVVPALNVLLRWLTDKPITSPLRAMDAARPAIMRAVKK